MILIGNKCDLSSVRTVSSVEAEKVSTCDMHVYVYYYYFIYEQLTKELKDIPYIEISAKTGQNINGVCKVLLNYVSEFSRSVVNDVQLSMYLHMYVCSIAIKYCKLLALLKDQLYNNTCVCTYIHTTYCKLLHVEKFCGCRTKL